MMDAQLKKLWQPLAIVAALLFVYAGILKKLVNDWWLDENYSHGLLIPFVIAYIIWVKRARLRQIEIHPSHVSGGVMFLFALLFLWAGTAGAELFTQRISLVIMITALIVYFLGWRLFSRLLFPLLLLVLAIPIPTIVLNKITFPLQLFASRCAVWAMQVFDISVLRQGNVIELMPLGTLKPVKLEIVAACSGIRSLMALVTLAALYAFFTYPPKSSSNNNGNENTTCFIASSVFDSLKTYRVWRSFLIVIASVPIAILTNALRVAGTGILAHHFGMQVAEGFFHTFSGWVVYVLAFVLMLMFGWALDSVRRKSASSKFKTQDSRFSDIADCQLPIADLEQSTIDKDLRPKI
jgi:exosortase